MSIPYLSSLSQPRAYRPHAACSGAHICASNFPATSPVFTRACADTLSGSAWGAGTFAGPDGSRQPSALELEVATLQGKHFWNTLAKVKF